MRCSWKLEHHRTEHPKERKDSKEIDSNSTVIFPKELGPYQENSSQICRGIHEYMVILLTHYFDKEMHHSLKRSVTGQIER